MLGRGPRWRRRRCGYGVRRRLVCVTLEVDSERNRVMGQTWGSCNLESGLCGAERLCRVLATARLCPRSGGTPAAVSRAPRGRYGLQHLVQKNPEDEVVLSGH